MSGYNCRCKDKEQRDEIKRLINIEAAKNGVNISDILYKAIKEFVENHTNKTK